MTDIRDVCVVGIGGVVGLSIARELSQRGFSVVGFEKHATPLQETSGRNSRVIHSGFHESPGTLKARLSREGSRTVLNYARIKGIGLLETGMVIAVPRGGLRQGVWRDGYQLWNIWRASRAQDIPFQFIFTPSGIRKLVPVEAVGGIFIPSVAVVDVEQLIACLEGDALAAGCDLHYSSQVKKIESAQSDFVVSADTLDFRARVLVNSAGLYASDVSRMAGGPDYPIEFVCGEYYELDGGRERWQIHRLVYPAMPPGSPSKGIHLGPRVDGRLFIGPNAYVVKTPMDYESFKTPKSIFLEAARRFLPDLTEKDLIWAYSGIRPRVRAATGKSDFVIRLEQRSPAFINLIGIDSPGLSSSLAIANHVANIIKDVLER